MTELPPPVESVATRLNSVGAKLILDDICRLFIFKTNYHLERSLYV